MKAVLLDVYGTLVDGPRSDDPGPTLEALLRRRGIAPPPGDLGKALDREVAREHAASTDPHPEVDIREIWQRLLPGLRDADGFALAAEEAVHPVTLLPGARDALRAFHAAGLSLGIVSNAQAYTRTILARLLGPEFDLLDPRLMVFSHEHRTAKPGDRIYRIALERLASRGIAPHEALMIGDSIANDVHPARALGLHTHHFRTWPEALHASGRACDA